MRYRYARGFRDSLDFEIPEIIRRPSHSGHNIWNNDNHYENGAFSLCIYIYACACVRLKRRNSHFFFSVCRPFQTSDTRPIF